MRPTPLLLVLTLALSGLVACGGPDGTTGDADTDAVLMLPDAYYAEWEHTETSGGLDGEGVPMPQGPPARIVITRGNVWETHAPNGDVFTRRFVVKKGKTIFSADEQWIVVFEGGGPELVLQISPDGKSFSTSENVYDGFSSSYVRRTKSTVPGGQSRKR